VGADLHDGPAQYLGLAALRLDRILPATEAAGDEAKAIRSALDTALSEIRNLSRGLSLPDLEQTPLREVVERAVDLHRRHVPTEVRLAYSGISDPPLDASARISAFRFLQEALSNASRHAEGPVGIAVEILRDWVEIRVTDAGPGFDPDAVLGIRADGGQGLPGLRDRAESIGGDLKIDSAPGRRTLLRLRLPLARRDTA